MNNSYNSFFRGKEMPQSDYFVSVDLSKCESFNIQNSRLFTVHFEMTLCLQNYLTFNLSPRNKFYYDHGYSFLKYRLTNLRTKISL